MLVAVASVKGSPGVTSTSLALAATWPRPAVLLEADPSGGDVAYRCRAVDGGPVAASTGLVSLAAAVRSGVQGAGGVVAESQMLACGVRLVQGVSSAAQGRGLGRLWSTVAEAARASDVDVIADLGRVDRDGPATPLAQAADWFLLVAAASLPSVMHLSAGLGELAAEVPAAAGQRLVPVLVGPDAHARSDCADLDEVLAAAGHHVAESRAIAFDRPALERLERGVSAGRVSRTLLLRSSRALANALTGVDAGRAASWT